MKYGIIGTGAVGGYYGALLVRQGLDVHFLLRSDYEHVKNNGLIIDSVNGDFRLPNVNAYSKPAHMPVCDVAVIALKTTQNHHLSEILPHVVKENGTIIVLQNGLAIEDDIAKIAPAATIIGGLCFLCSNKVGPGHIHHLDYGAIRFGQYRHDGLPAGIQPALKEVSGTFESAGIKTHLTDNLGQARWEKLVWNMAFNGVCAVLNATTDKLMECGSSLSLVRDIMLEVIRGAQKCGFSLKENFADKMIRTTKDMAVYSPSMKLDFESGRPLEIETIYWRPIRAAESAGCGMTTSRVIALQLEFLDRQNNSL